MAYPFQIRSQTEYEEQYLKSVEEPESFWAGIAGHFSWKRKWDKVLEWNFTEPSVKWFEGAELNIAENCLDRHLAKNGDVPAIIWEPNDPSQPSKTFSYKELHFEVCLFAQMLRDSGIVKGDRVCIYMGMVPELVIAVLACARIGAIHSVIFGGFSARSIADRVQDARAVCMITADGAWRGAKEIPLKPIVDEALKECPTIKKVLVLAHTQTSVNFQEGRDEWIADALKGVDVSEAMATPAAVMNAEDPLFILYTSGSTGKPKGVVHTCGGYMVFTTYSFVNVFQYNPGDVYFCTADVGWITGHSYIVYGPLCAGATVLLFEGVPTWPHAGRFWEIVDKYQVNILYTAPTAIRSLMTYGLDPLKGKDLSSLKVMGTVGEPINEEAWHWYHEHVGKGNCPIVDTWWQTETGGILISNLAGVTDAKPTHATLPLPGIQPCLMDEKGNEAPPNLPEGEGHSAGNLCIKFPWPSMLRTTWGDHERCRTTYFNTYPGKYFTGDGALLDSEGNYRITGRVDDVLNVSGHRIGTAEVENAINQNNSVFESAVVGYPHDIKGQGIYAFVVASEGHSDTVHKEIMATVTELIGPFARPDKIQLVSGLPKTRSGKIMRRILRKIAEGDVTNLGDTSTLLDPAVVEEILKGSQ